MKNLKYLLLGCIAGLLAVWIGGLIGCASPYLVRECGATVGDHFDSQDFGWVQPCDRPDGVAGVPGDLEGCSSNCRRARGACETDYAMFRDPKLWMLDEKHLCSNGRCKTKAGRDKMDQQAQDNLQDIEVKMKIDCDASERGY